MEGKRGREGENQLQLLMNTLYLQNKSCLIDTPISWRGGGVLIASLQLVSVTVANNHVSTRRLILIWRTCVKSMQNRCHFFIR